MLLLRELFDNLPEGLRHEALTHSSWCEDRSLCYERLAFLGDSVLSLSISTYLYPRLSAKSYGAGRLTKVRAQTVSGKSCSLVTERLGLQSLFRELADSLKQSNSDELLGAERVRASIAESVIGACYLEYGYDQVAEAVVEAFTPEMELALEHTYDYKSKLQEKLARRGDTVTYEVMHEEGPPHQRVFQVAALVSGEELGEGSGRSKKLAEQEAARSALDSIRDGGPVV